MKVKRNLIKVKEESEKAGLKRNIQKTKIMASGPLTSWQIEGDFPRSLVDKESTCNADDPGSISVLGRSPGEGNGNPLHYSCLENPMYRGAWRGLQSMESQELEPTEQLSMNMST